jgi:hypothetical protein
MEPSPDQNRLAVSHTEGDDELDEDIGILAAALSAAAAGSARKIARAGVDEIPPNWVAMSVCGFL